MFGRRWSGMGLSIQADCFVPTTLGFEQVFDGFAHRTLPAGSRRDERRSRAHLGRGIGDRSRRSSLRDWTRRELGPETGRASCMGRD